jgi:hypothetical protein
VGDDLPVPARSPHPLGRLQCVLEDAEQQMLGSDLTVAQGMCLFAGQLQGPLGDKRRAAQRRPHHPCAPPPAPAGNPPGRLPHRAKAERLLGLVSDGLQVDAHRAQQLAITGPRRRHHPPFGQASQRGPGRRQVHPSGLQQPSGLAVALGEQPEQDMLGAKVAVASPLGLPPGQVQDPMGLLGEAAEHLLSPDPEPSIRRLSSSARLGYARPKPSQQVPTELVQVDAERLE